jgi:hypothetical protein
MLAQRSGTGVKQGIHTAKSAHLRPQGKAQLAAAVLLASSAALRVLVSKLYLPWHCLRWNTFKLLGSQPTQRLKLPASRRHCSPMS